jgi:hypothetical protein
MKYTRGPVTTELIMNKPTVAAIKSWYNDMKLIIERSGYEAYIVGRSLTNISQTLDVDIVYLGEYKPEAIEHLLIQSLVTGFRHKILVDARWQNKIETAEYKDNKIKILDTQFMFLNYFEHDYGNGYKIINDYRLNPVFKVVNENLVFSTFDRITPRLKPHLIEQIVKNGKLAHLLLKEYCKE